MVSFSWPNNANGTPRDRSSTVAEPDLNPAQAEELLQGLARVFSQQYHATARHVVYPPEQPRLRETGQSQQDRRKSDTAQFPNLEARYRALVEQIPAVVFMAYLDRGIGEA